MVSASSHILDRARHVIAMYGMQEYSATEVAEKMAEQGLLGMDTVIDVADALAEYHGRSPGE